MISYGSPFLSIPLLAGIYIDDKLTVAVLNNTELTCADGPDADSCADYLSSC